MSIKSKIERLIVQAIEKSNFDLGGEGIKIEYPDFFHMGDFTTKIALPLSQKTKQNPREIAENILSNIQNSNLIEKTEIAGSGFINIFLSKEFYRDFLIEKTSKKGDVELFIAYKNKTILVEHSSPNLFKPFHVGHLVNNFIGQSITNILTYAGAKSEQIAFPSDISPGIAKAIWAILNDKSFNENNLNAIELGRAYVVGVAAYDKNKKEIDQINKDIYEQKEGESLNIYKKGKKISLDYFLKVTKELGSEFKDIIFESEAEILGKEKVLKYPKLFQKSDGAYVFFGSQYGLYDSVFINSAGFGTYLAKDFGLLTMKKQRYKFDESILLADIEQKQHFQLVKKAESLVDKENAEKTKYISHGRMTFSGSEKVSSRYGNVPSSEEIISQIKQKVLEKMEEGDRGLTENQKEKLSEDIARASIKYTILKVKSGKNISFDMKKDLSIEGNSASYLLYAHVRATSILKKVNFKEIKLENLKVSGVSNLEKLLPRFDVVVLKSASEFSAHHIANYIHKLSTEFNSFYANTKVLDKENPDYQYNIMVLKKFIEVMELGFNILGIQKVNKM